MIRYGTIEYYKHKCELLEVALKEACQHIHILQGGLGNNIDREYTYFLKNNGLDSITLEKKVDRFSVGQLVAAPIPVKSYHHLCENGYTPRLYIGEIIKIESDDMALVSFGKETQKLAREEIKCILESPSTALLYMSKIWSAEDNYTLRSYLGYEIAVKVIQFIEPNKAVIRRDDGTMLIVNVNNLKYARKD